MRLSATFLLCLLTSCHAQITTSGATIGAGQGTGTTTLGSPSVGVSGVLTPYIPTTTLSEIRDNNTSGCAAVNAPSVGPTGCQDNLPAVGVRQTRFPIVKISRVGTTVTVTLHDTYNFSLTHPDSVKISGVSGTDFPAGTYPLIAKTATTLQYTQAGNAVTVSGSGGSNHVFVIMLENRSISNAMLYMPYLAGLVNNNNSSSAYGVAQGLQIYSNSHGSFAAYLQLTSGTVNNGSGTGYALTTINFSGGGSVSNDCNGDGCSANAPASGAGVVDVPNLVRQFAADTKTWRAYLESKPAGANGYFTYTSGNWVRRHNPFAFYSPEITTEPSLGVFTAQAAAANQVDTTNMLNDINNNTLANYTWLSPNLVHDAHNQGPDIPSCSGNADCIALGNADIYLQTFMPQLLASPPFQPGGDGVLLVTFDESELSGDNQCGNNPETNNCGGHILSVLIGPNVKKGYSSSTHYKQDSQLRLVCDLLKLSACPGNGAAAPAMTEFFASSNTASGTAIRYAQTDTYVPAPKNVANLSSDGVDPHKLVYLNNGGGTTTAKIFALLVPYFDCANAKYVQGATSGNCVFTPADGLKTGGDNDSGQNQSASHVTVGYVSNNANQIHAERLHMARLGFDGVIIDYDDPPFSGNSAQRANEAAAAVKWRDELVGQSTFKIMMQIDSATVKSSNTCGTNEATMQPSCVEKVLACTLDYFNTASNQTFMCVAGTGNGGALGSCANGVGGANSVGCMQGGGFFASPAYYSVTGHLQITTFFNSEAIFYTFCTVSAPCAVYNNGSGGTCTSSSSCWSKIYGGLTAHIATGFPALDWTWRNNFSHTPIGPAANNGSYRWINPTGDQFNLDFAGYDSWLATASTSTKPVWTMGFAKNDHAQSSFQDDTLFMGNFCGTTWMRSWSEPAKNNWFTPAKDIKTIQLVTWNDVEQGTRIEEGIPVCYGINASMAGDGHTLGWNITTNDATYAPLSPLNNTLHHIALYVSADGINVMKLGSNITPSATGSIDLYNFGLTPGTYMVYVKLVPWTDMQTSITSALSFVAP